MSLAGFILDRVTPPDPAVVKYHNARSALHEAFVKEHRSREIAEQKFYLSD
jgi:hypothetical protein